MQVEFFAGERHRGFVCKTAREYIARIRQVAQDDPTLLIAYAQTMYMALLSGGQIMRRIQRTAMGLQGTEGGAIFEFEQARHATHYPERLQLHRSSAAPEHFRPLPPTSQCVISQ